MRKGRWPTMRNTLKIMRNTILKKYFSLSIYLIIYALSEINENMRNEIKKNFSSRIWSKCF